MGYSPDQAIELLAARLKRVGVETIQPVPGRVLAQPISADRDSPAADVSAMDGYAVRLADIVERSEVSVSGEIQPGIAPIQLPVHSAMRIFTGAVIPEGAQLVVKREDTTELPQRVVWSDVARRLPLGANIRRQGENGRAGAMILAPGTVLTPASIAAAVNFGAAHVSAFVPVVCSVIVTGNELLDVTESPAPWQLRDSNGPTVAAMISRHPWLRVGSQGRCGDVSADLRTKLLSGLQHSDAVILTGGVSKGDYDHVPEVIESIGGEIVFHRLPIRPGQPILGAVTPSGQLILGLPGNPVSTACCMQRIGMPLLKVLAGYRDWNEPVIQVTVDPADDKTLPLHWMRLVRLTHSVAEHRLVRAEYVATKGSGDLVSLGISDGFIEIPPGECGPGPWPFYRW